MNTKFLLMRSMRKTIAHLVGIFILLALLLPVPSIAHAAPASPFLGQWQADDLDGSDIRLSIAGRPSGPFQITWTENYFSFCGGTAGIVRGTGWLNPDNPYLLEADMRGECFVSGNTVEFHLVWRYHPATNRLSSRYDNGMVTIWRRPGKPQAPPPSLYLRVNYGHDWVESFYDGGHSVWVTVTESDGVTVKATTESFTEAKDFLGGETGFQTQADEWSPGLPDILPGDWVFAWVDNGANTQMQIGDISGMIDLEADSISGTVSAPWYSDPVQVECLDWGSGQDPPFETIQDGSILPNGSDAYYCQWEQWDIQLGQTVGVGYFGPDGHWVANVFYSNARIVASVVGDWFWTADFRPFEELNISIYESRDAKELGADPLWVGTSTANEWGFIFVGPDVHSRDLVPGNLLTISDSVVEKRLELEYINIDLFDPEDDIMAGTAPAGRQVWVVAGMAEAETQAYLEAVAWEDSGLWFADFKSLPFDITEDMRVWSFAHIYDEDWDANEGNSPPPPPESAIMVPAVAGWVDTGFDIEAGSFYTITAAGVVLTGLPDEFPGAISNPDGQSWNLGCGQYEIAPPPCSMDNALYGSLVGKIGEDGEPFFMGSFFTLAPDFSGRLYLAVNDNEGFHSDNNGRFVVVIE